MRALSPCLVWDTGGRASGLMMATCTLPTSRLATCRTLSGPQIGHAWGWAHTILAQVRACWYLVTIGWQKQEVALSLAVMYLRIASALQVVSLAGGSLALVSLTPPARIAVSSVAPLRQHLLPGPVTLGVALVSSSLHPSHDSFSHEPRFCV